MKNLIGTIALFSLISIPALAAELKLNPGESTNITVGAKTKVTCGTLNIISNDNICTFYALDNGQVDLNIKRRDVSGDFKIVLTLGRFPDIQSATAERDLRRKNGDCL